MVLISVIISVYNQESFLTRCIDSVLAQNFEDFEIILVNDGATDNSQVIIDEYVQKDTRIRSIIHENNKGLMEARRTGVNNARGKYCQQLDSNYTLQPGSLSAISKIIAKKFPDFIQFSLDIVNDNGVKLHSLNYHHHPLFNQQVFETLFVNNKYNSWNLCGKTILTSLLKKAFGEIPHIHIVQMEDFLLTYITSYFSNHYEYCTNATLNYYQHDDNSYNRDLNNSRHYELWMKNVKNRYLVLNNFKIKYQIDKQYSLIKSEELLILTELRQFFKNIDTIDQQKKIIDIYDAIGIDKVFNIFNKYIPLAHLLHLIPAKKKKTPKKIKTIAIVARTNIIGGTEKLIFLLSSFLAKEGYKVYIFFERIDMNLDSLNDFPENVVVEHNSNDNFFLFMDQKIKEYNIDCIHIHQYLDKQELLFLMYAEFQDILTIVSRHTIAVIPMYWGEYPYFFKHALQNCADVITVLSQSDKLFLQQVLTTPIVYMPNLLTFELEQSSITTLEENNIIYIGRIEYEKRVDFIINAFHKVIQKNPLAKLTILGNGREFISIQNLIKTLGLSDNVFLKGSVLNVKPYLEKASLLLLPSYFEGFPMVVGEALSHGVPVLMSYLPSNELNYCEGVVTFDKYKEDVFVNNICDLLNNKEKLKQLSKKAKESIKKYDNQITIKRWKELLEGLSESNIPQHLLSVEKKLTQDEINNIYYQEYHQSKELIFQNIVKEFDIESSKSITKTKIQKGIKKLIPEYSFQYRVIRKILYIITYKIIPQINKILNIKY
ncbi:MAG: glycosyltransferase [Brevinema sp.]